MFPAQFQVDYAEKKGNMQQPGIHVFVETVQDYFLVAALLTPGGWDKN